MLFNLSTVFYYSFYLSLSLIFIYCLLKHFVGLFWKVLSFMIIIIMQVDETFDRVIVFTAASGALDCASVWWREREIEPGRLSHAPPWVFPEMETRALAAFCHFLPDYQPRLKHQDIGQPLLQSLCWLSPYSTCSLPVCSEGLVAVGLGLVHCVV